MADARTKHIRQLQRLRRSARAWSVRTGVFVGAASVLIPYQGIGLPDAIWAAAAGGSATLAAWRWNDLRVLAKRPVPQARGYGLIDAKGENRIINFICRVPAGRVVIDEINMRSGQFRMRGVAAGDVWRRIDQASLTFSLIRDSLSEPAMSLVADADTAEHSLRDLAVRSASVERALRSIPERNAMSLAQANTLLLRQLSDGVDAYERLVSAAVAYAAEDLCTPGPSPAINSLSEAAELLRCVADSLSELRRTVPL